MNAKELMALVAALDAFQEKFWQVAERHNDRSCDHDVCKEVRDYRDAVQTLRSPEFAAMVEDAERWRHMRRNPDYFDWDALPLGLVPPHDEDLELLADAAIDAARGKA